MTTNNIPAYVKSTLTAERTAQSATYTAVCVWVFNATKAEETISELGAKLHKAGDFRSLKTWQNYASVITALSCNAQVVVKLESLHAADPTPEEMCAAFGPWLAQQLRIKGHTNSIDDVACFAKGKPSLKAQAKAAADSAATGDEDRAATKAVQGEEAGSGDVVPDTGKTGYASAVLPTIDLVFNARIEGDELTFTFGERATRADLVQALETLQAYIDNLAPEASTLPVIEEAML